MATSTNYELIKLCGPRDPYPGENGVVKEGALADLLVVDGDPMENIDLIADPDKNFMIIMKNGFIRKPCNKSRAKAPDPGSLLPSGDSRSSSWLWLRHALKCCLIGMLSSNAANAQQFVGDNQWVAPQGVATIVGTAGQDYMQFYLVAALLQEWEFNAQFVHYYDDPRTGSDSYTTSSFYAKRRFWQNEAETAGYAALAGVGLFPQHLDQGEVTSSFRSWWATAVATYAFANNNILLDVLPGVAVNFDHKQSSNTAWGFTYSSRLAIYKIIPQSAVVGEVFGTAGEAQSPVSYRVGVRWESPKWIVAGTYSSAFNSSFGAGFEIGLMFFTEPLFGSGRQPKAN